MGRTQLVAQELVEVGHDVGMGFEFSRARRRQLAPFLDEIPPELMGFGERNSLLPGYRGTGASNRTRQPIQSNFSAHCAPTVHETARPAPSSRSTAKRDMKPRCAKRSATNSTPTTPTASPSTRSKCLAFDLLEAIIPLDNEATT